MCDVYLSVKSGSNAIYKAMRQRDGKPSRKEVKIGENLERDASVTKGGGVNRGRKKAASRVTEFMNGP